MQLVSHLVISRANLKISLVLLALCFSSVAQGQYMEYNFNSPGSPCYFSYICYSPRGVYNTNRQPFLFVLGRPGESAQETYNADSLKGMPAFYNYTFVYIPNKGVTPAARLNCLDALSSLLTNHYEYGHANLFLKVNDPEIEAGDIAINRLGRIFKTIRLFEFPEQDTVLLPGITKDFSETHINYDLSSGKAEDETGTYYIDESVDAPEEDALVEKPRKTYFGKPQARNFTLTGIVRDKSTGEALPFATIMVSGTTAGTATNADGHFTLLKVPSDTSVLIVQYIGYDRTEVFLNPYLPKKNMVIEVRQSAYTLKAVSIVGKKEDVVLAGRTEVSTLKMTPRKMEQLPGLGEKDILRSFQLMPGISASNESSSGLYVRGGTPDQNLVLYDGFTVYHVDHLYGFFSAFNSNALKDVQLHKGGFESRFGGRLSSVTEITGKDGNQKRFNIGGDLSLLSMNFYAEVPVGKKFTSVLAYRRSYQGALYNAIFEKFNLGGSNAGANEVRPGPGGRQVQDAEVTNYFYDLNGKFSYRVNDKDMISLSFFNGTDKLDNGSALSAPGFGMSGRNFNMNTTDLTRYGNIGSSLKWSRKWNERLYGNTILSYSNYYSDRDRTQERSSVNADDETINTKMGVLETNNLRDYSLKSDYQWDILRGSQFQFGAFSTFYNIEYTYAQNDTSNVLDKHNQAFLSGAYVQSRTKLFGDRLTLIPGIRTSLFSITGKTYTEPRFAATFNISDRLTLKASTGKFFQFVNRVTREDILSGSRDFWLLSDQVNVPVSSAVHYIAGLAYESNDYLFSAEAYFKHIHDITEYSLRFNTSPAGFSYNENFFSGSGVARGIEMLAQKKAGRLNGWVSYTLGEADNKFEVYSDQYFPANQDVTHEFKAVSLYKYKRWDFSATWIFATGRPYTAPSGAYQVTLLDGTTQDFFTVTAKNSVRLPDYHRFDLAVNFKLLKGARGERKRQEIGYIGVSLFNVYNRKNVWYKTFTIEDGSILETNVNYLGLTPNLTLSLRLR
ncbi:MAG: TonB-dependent receptor [Lentimicrobium sp.]|uniref:TonB-dependent receptor n=3 Tax=Lentimicrobium sp. TaxID=2034841 RepID=UPI0025D87892|nr:TonB-dependent receptor [Lentimicrobium sp.]MCO5257906.1 TonB-dependent receptor [Lentimicrobium sp.]MCO5261815.1 TonB-dependent receptor [Lentimicrobium sp.]